MTGTVVRVLVVDDQALIRGGLVALLTAAPGFEVVGQAGDGEEAVAQASALEPDVVLMDIRMPVMDGIEATRRILGSAGTPPAVLILTTYDLDEYVYTAIGAGAAGFLLKDTPPDRILSAVASVVAGEILISPRITRRLVETYALQQRSAPDDSTLATLTNRETEVLRLVANGLSNPEIASRLVLSEETVRTHVKRVMAKLGVSSRAQAVVVAYETRLVVPDPGRS